MDRNSKEFKKLQETWDNKLKRSGFQDIEQRDGHLKTWSTQFVLDHSDSQIEAKQEYYRAAGHFLHEYKFTHPAERRIWELHCAGISKVATVAILESEKLWFKKRKKTGWTHHRPCATTVQVVLTRLKKMMLRKIEDGRQNS